MGVRLGMTNIYSNSGGVLVTLGEERQAYDEQRLSIRLSMNSVSEQSRSCFFRISMYFGSRPSLQWSWSGIGLGLKRTSLNLDSGADQGQRFVSSLMFSKLAPVLVLAFIATIRAMTATSLLGLFRSERKNLMYLFITCCRIEGKPHERRLSTKKVWVLRGSSQDSLVQVFQQR